MASVTGYTAARMKAIEDSSIIGGAVVGDNLILTRYNATTINAGSVRGATGPTGPSGEVTLAQLNAAVPAGSVMMWMFSTLPTGWLSLEGQTILNGQTTYPSLWAVAPAGWKSGSSLTLPDLRGRFPVGQNISDTIFDVLQEVGGSKNAIAVSHTHGIDGHTHTSADHNHGLGSHVHTTDDHTHTISIESSRNKDLQDYVTRLTAPQNNGFATGKYMTPWDAQDPPVLAGTAGYGTSNTYAVMSVSYVEPHRHDIAGTTSLASNGNMTVSQVGGTLTLGASTGNITNGQTGGTVTATQTPSADGTNANLPPYLVLRFIIKA